MAYKANDIKQWGGAVEAPGQLCAQTVQGLCTNLRRSLDGPSRHPWRGDSLVSTLNLEPAGPDTGQIQISALRCGREGRGQGFPGATPFA